MHTIPQSMFQGFKNFPKVHRSRTSEHQESTGPEKFSFYKIKFTAASDHILNCQPKIVILNNICYSVTTKGVS
jgi:hypothetical protein